MIVSIPMEIEDPRRPYEEVAGYELGTGGASPRGSTFARRAQLCARESLLSNDLRWEVLPRAKALDIGLLWHGVLEHYYLGVQAAQHNEYREVTPDTAAFRFLQRFRSEDGWGKFYEIVSCMLDAYLTRWQNADQAWRILSVEYTCGWTKETHPLVYTATGFELTTRLDLLVEDWTLTPVSRHIEHKSAHALDPQTVTAYSLDDQIYGQCYLGRYWTDWTDRPPYVGCLVNVCTKAKTPRLARLPVQPSDVHLEEWAKSKRYWQWQREQYPALGHPKNFINCTRRFGRCQFFEFCRSRPELDAQKLIQLNRQNDLPLNVVRIER